MLSAVKPLRPGLRLGLVLEQITHDFQLTFPCGLHQRRMPLPPPGFEIGPRLDEPGNDLGPALLGRFGQRGRADAVARLQIGTGRHERLDFVEFALIGRDHDCRRIFSSLQRHRAGQPDSQPADDQKNIAIGHANRSARRWFAAFRITPRRTWKQTAGKPTIALAGPSNCTSIGSTARHLEPPAKSDSFCPVADRTCTLGGYIHGEQLAFAAQAVPRRRLRPDRASRPGSPRTVGSRLHRRPDQRRLLGQGQRGAFSPLRARGSRRRAHRRRGSQRRGDRRFGRPALDGRFRHQHRWVGAVRGRAVVSRLGRRRQLWSAGWSAP